MTTLAHQPPQLARANNIDICYEVFGDANAEPLLLIMGLVFEALSMVLIMTPVLLPQPPE